MYALSKVLSRDENYANVVIIDAGGETTDVGIVFGGGIAATRTLSLGGRHMTRILAETFNVNMREAEELKVRYTLANISPDQALIIKESLDKVLALWVSGLEVLFSDFDGIRTFPSKVYLVGGASALNEVLEVLRKEPWTKHIPFKEPPSFERAYMSTLNGLVDYSSKTIEVEDIMPVSLAEVYLEMERGGV